jgi:small subunit ribosomal protein S4
MGDPRSPKKSYKTPSHPWEGDRIEAEKELTKKYGLRNKREIWKAQAKLEGYRRQSMNLTARLRGGDAQTAKERQWLLVKMQRLGFLEDTADLTDILTLSVEHVLNRRLQTIVYLKGLASSPKQARQIITHGHVAIRGKRITVPGYMISVEEEHHITYYPYSPLADELHPVRPQARRPAEEEVDA